MRPRARPRVLVSKARQCRMKRRSYLAPRIAEEMEVASRARAYCAENTAMPYENHGCECLLQKVYLAFRIANARTRTAPEITHHDHAPDDTAAPSATTGGTST